MTGLEPHPIFKLPTQEQVRAAGAMFADPERRAVAERAYFDRVITERKRRMELEQSDPLRAGYEAPIWHVVDDLLCDGVEVKLVVPDANGVRVPGPIIKGAPEILVTGSNRSSKSEYAAKKIVKILEAEEGRRTWCFADTEAISIARQQPVVYRYLPSHLKRLAGPSGKFKEGSIAKIGWTQANGFVGGTFVLPGKSQGSQNWFKNYKQNPADLEGDQLDGIWLDELRDPELLKTLRVRLGDRGGLMLVTFTSIDDNYTTILDEYRDSSVTVMEQEAELLPIWKPKAGGNLPVPVLAEKGAANASPDKARESTENCDRTGKGSSMADSRGGQNPLLPACFPDSRPGMELAGYEKVPRVEVAGPGSDGNQRANIVYFHITDNPFYGFTAKPKKGEKALFGKERFYALWRNATRSKILSRVYGVLVRQRNQQFNFNSAVHVISRERVAGLMRAYPNASRYHLVDPCSGRNWFMGWSFHWAPRKVLIYREWPSHGHPKAYIPGIGDPGAWALSGPAHDGMRGPAQTPFRFGLDDYKREILRLEGDPDCGLRIEETGKKEDRTALLVPSPMPPNPLKNPRIIERDAPRRVPGSEPEEITERWMDCRYGNAAVTDRESPTTLIEQMERLEMEFRAMTGEKNILAANDGSIDMINQALAYDPAVPLGTYSPALSRLNEPELLISEDCPNTIFALQKWTGIDGQKGACKDPIDILRGLYLSELDYVGQDAFVWVGGGVS